MTAPGLALLVAAAGVVVVVAVALLPPLAAAAVAGGGVVAAGWATWRWGRRTSAAVTPARAAPSTSAPAMEAVLDRLAEGVLLLDEEREVLTANEAAARILGRPRDSMVGVSLIRAARDHALVELLRESSGEPHEVMLLDQRIVLASATPVRQGGVHTVVVLQDLTTLRHAERARQDLVANVSHELRTPIAAALALAETLEGGVDDERLRSDFARRLTGEVKRLALIVERLLRLSRIESRVEEFDIETLDVGALLAEAAERVAALAGRRDVRVELTPVSGLAARGDRDRVLEVLTNLLDNAIRFSPAGGAVGLDASRAGSMVEFTVSDEGSGIAPPDRLRVFERFYTGERSRTTVEGTAGTGLGLSIARHIVSRLGGEIWVGDEGPGATLHFTLPSAR